MKTRSQQALIQMVLVLATTVCAAALICLWKLEFVRDIYFSDAKTIILNGVIIVLFLLGIMQLYRGLVRYSSEEMHTARFIALKEEGSQGDAPFDDDNKHSLIANRYYTVRSLFNRGVPINHSAISAIMVAEESLNQSFPKFVNNVLILTGVFGTVTSLIFALVGASDVLQTALPGEGMGVMLLGMNTALTTTATAIVCFFFFTFFYQKLMDVQTHLLSQIERAVLIYIIPDFAFDTESINHQTESLIMEVRGLISELHGGVGNMEKTLAGFDRHHDTQMQKWDTVLEAQLEQQGKVESVLSYLDSMKRLLIEGFRLK